MLRPLPLPSPFSSMPMTKVGRWYCLEMRDATMPTTPGCQPRADDDGVAAPRGRETGDEPLRVLAGGELEFLALAVLPVERLGEEAGPRGILTKQQVERGHGRVEAARGVEAWTELETDVVGADRARHSRDALQGDEPRAHRALELGEPAAGEKAVFRLERNDVGDGAEGDDVEMVLQVEARDGPRPEEGMGDLEDDTRGAEVVVIVPSFGLTRATHPATPSGEGSWWSRMMRSMPRSRRIRASSREFVPQSAAMRRSGEWPSRQFSMPFTLRP